MKIPVAKNRIGAASLILGDRPPRIVVFCFVMETSIRLISSSKIPGLIESFRTRNDLRS